MKAPLGAYSEDDIANLINTEVDEGNKAGHEPLRRACTIQKTLKVISYVFGIPMKTLFHLCGPLPDVSMILVWTAQAGK